MKDFNDDNENHPDRKGTGTDEDGENSDNTQPSKDDTTDTPPQAAVSDTPDESATQESVTAYKLDSQGNKIAVNITSADALKIADIIYGKNIHRMWRQADMQPFLDIREVNIIMTQNQRCL